MKHSVITCQGRVADRTAGAVIGARLTAEALGAYLDVRPHVVGRPVDAVVDDWTEALPGARETLGQLTEALAAAMDAGDVPVLATNTCAASLATLPEVARRHPDAAVLWIDAHGDFNTPATTESGYLGGMVLAAACGLWDSGHGAGLDPRQVAVIGARDIDPAERDLLDGAGVTVLSPSAATPAAVLDFVGGRPVYVHIDWDVLEPGYIPAAYKISNGLRPHQVADVLDALSSRTLLGLELAEFEAGEPGVPEEFSLELILETIQPIIKPAR